MDIVDYNGNPIRTVSSLDNNSQLAVFYPGYGYTLNAPVFYYLRELFSQRGYDILGIDYRYYENIDFLSADDEKKEIWFKHDCCVIGKAVNDFSKTYNRIVYVGKSMGTTVMMNQLKDNLIQEKSELIYLTPGPYARELYAETMRTKHRTLIVYGNADKYYNKKDVDLIRGRKDTYIKEIENAGHSFEVEGNIKQSILNLAEVVDAINDFIK